METGSGIFVVVVLALTVVVVRLLLEMEERRISSETAEQTILPDREATAAGDLTTVRQKRLWSIANRDVVAALRAGLEGSLLHGLETLADIRARELGYPTFRDMEQRSDPCGEDELLAQADRYLAIRFHNMLAARVQGLEAQPIGALPAWTLAIDPAVLARMFSETENRALDDLSRLIRAEVEAQDKLDLPLTVPWKAWGAEILKRAGRPRSTAQFLEILGGP